jgi:hypothetical protein
VILFNGAGQSDEDIDRGCKFPGQMHCLIDGLGMKYVYADATGPMARWFSRNYRHWLWSNDVVLIIDDIHAHTAGRMDWLLHYDGEYTADSEDAVTLKNGAAQAVVKMLYPANKHREEVGLTDHNPDRKVPYLVFYPMDTARSRQFITAICLNPEAMPKFEVLEGDNYVGVRVHAQHSVEETYLNLRAINGSIHTSSGIQIEEWMTDAYLLQLSRPSAASATVDRYFVSDGSYLRREGRSVLEALSKETVCWSQGPRVKIFSSEPSAPIQIGAERRPQNVLWNGSPVSTVYDNEKRFISIKHRP